MKKFLALLLAALMSLSLAACGNSGNTSSATSASGSAAAGSAAPSDLKIGIILVGDENEGYSYAHIEGIEAAKKSLGLSDDQVIYKYSIPEDETCYDTACDLADSGCSLIISNSYSHQSYMVQAASEFPDVTFVACTGDTAAVCGLDNVKNAFPHTYEARYVSGVVAGLKLKALMDAGTVTDPHIGYVGAYPYAEVVSGYTAFFLGIRSIVPTAHMDVMYTNSWFDMNAESEAANALMAKGCVIIGQHADSTGAPSAVEAAFKAGKTVFSVGYNVDMLSVAPDVALTSAQNNWGAFYTYAFKCAMDGEEIATDWSQGHKDGANMISTLGSACAPGTQEAVDKVWAGIDDGSLQVFDTSTFTVDGKTLTSSTFDFSTMNADYSAVQYAGPTKECIVNGAFQESVFRSAPYFALHIDGITELS